MSAAVALLAIPINQSINFINFDVMRYVIFENQYFKN